MDSPRSGLRRAAAMSWALAGIGMAGVAGASALAYGDTVKPPPSVAPSDVVEQAPAEPDPDAPPTPAVTTPDPPPPTTTAPPPPPETTVDQAPVRTYTPQPTYAPETPVEQATVTQQSSSPTATASRTTQRRSLTPAIVNSPNFSPHVSRSHGT